MTRNPHRLRLWLAAAVALAFSGMAPAPGGSSAQQLVGGIVASVNDDAITDYDLDARARLIAISSGLPPSPEANRRIARQALRELIDDRLKIQEAERLGISANDQEIGAAVRTIERNNKMEAGGLFRQLTAGGVPVETLTEQVRATLLWRKVLRRRVLPQVSVATNEVDDALSRIREAGGGEIIRAAEIFLPASTEPEFERAIAEAQAIAGQAATSAQFAQLANRFSRAPTAAVGGDLGEIQPGQLAPELEDALSGLQPGETSPPIRTESGVRLMHLTSRRVIEGGNEAQATVTLARIYEPVQPPEDETALGARLQAAVDGAPDCDAFDAAAKRFNPTQPPRVVDARIGDLPEDIRATVASLQIGEMTEPFAIGDGVAIMMLCRRAEVGVGLPSAERVAEAIQQQRAERRAERYLRDLRRLAFIDVRR